MTSSVWNTTLDWNGLNKSESFTAVIIKVNPISLDFFRVLKKSVLGGCTKTLMLVLKQWDLEIAFENVWKVLKVSTSSIKFHWRQQLILEISKVTDI